MIIRRFLRTAAATLAVAIVALSALQLHARGTSLPEATAPDKNPDKDIVEVAVESDFSTLVAAVQAAGLVETLKSSGPFTVFAPTDEAFSRLPAGTLENLLKPEHRDQLAAVLSYHVVPGALTAAEVAGLASATTVQGAPVAIRSEGGSVQINGATVSQADVMASNGVIHVIDAVLLPPQN